MLSKPLECLLLVVMMCCAGLWDSSISVADDEPFLPLFDGKTLKGWEGNQKYWKVEDGMIVGDSPGIQHNDFLATRETYSDFELRLEFRLRDGKGNSGVQFRSRREKDGSAMIGYQADIGENYWGCLYDEHRRRRILAQSPPELSQHLKKDGWNSYVIRAQGTHVEQFINGFQTVDFVENEESIARDGVIALQIHSGPAMRIEFRKIMIRSINSR